MSTYTIAGPDIAFEEFDGDLVVLNLSTGQYFGFNDAAHALWEALVGGVSTSEIAAQMTQSEDLAPFVEKLVEFKLLATATATGSLSSQQVERIKHLSQKPSVDRYDDLADLIIADPIHDVETEKGWPELTEKPD